ncbi:class IV adenylate cyclase [Streptomyces nigrescens]|uniref:Class IV adenylate cyclase n=1 Tax=Streptomyces nigrescens TaxID=1920 RepID=A0ABY7IZ81_STRNI|nr:class IV adenylate cyclase [Streptomyces nigrescens]WAU04000.1 class IV adenylate cyclase [Streptomyces nigrescens]
MQTEFEARFLNVDATKIANQLVARSATCSMPRTLMRRIVFKNDDIEARGGWLRLRQQGDKTFLTYKQTTSELSAIDTTLESEVEVGSFDATKTLLEAMGFTALRYQENYREEWTLAGVTFDIDTWPDLPTFLEVEGPDEGSVRRAAETLGLDVSHASYGSVDEVYLAVLGRDILAEQKLVFAE